MWVEEEKEEEEKEKKKKEEEDKKKKTKEEEEEKEKKERKEEEEEKKKKFCKNTYEKPVDSSEVECHLTYFCRRKTVQCLQRVRLCMIDNIIYFKKQR